MYLHNTNTRFLTKFRDEDIPEYAILSYCWTPPTSGIAPQDFTKACKVAESGHQRFINFCRDSHKTQPLGVTNIIKFCRLARQLGYDWVWIEVLCVDKFRKSQVEEYINSMWRWYQRAGMCIAYLDDVFSCDTNWVRNTKWFDQCWTLQALLAPHDVHFYDRNWRLIQTKRESDCVAAIETRTGIPTKVLLEPDVIPSIGVATRMSWSSGRTAPKPEDVAYSVVGLFGVSLSRRYGEGGPAAFERLQRAILEKNAVEFIRATNAGESVQDMD